MKALAAAVVIVTCIPYAVVAASREAFRATAAVPAWLVLVILTLLVLLAVLYVARMTRR